MLSVPRLQKYLNSPGIYLETPDMESFGRATIATQFDLIIIDSTCRPLV